MNFKDILKKVLITILLLVADYFISRNITVNISSIMSDFYNELD